MEQTAYWVTDSGTADESMLAETVRGCNLQNGLFLAFFTDGMLSGHTDALSGAEERFDRLLELRIFNDERELWAHRSMLNQPFAYRVADDAALNARIERLGRTDFFGDPAHYRIETEQYLDVNEKNPPSGEPKVLGNKCLRTTGGGVYELPIRDGQNAVRLVQYLSYNGETGAARIADFRIKGFTAKETRRA